MSQLKARLSLVKPSKLDKRESLILAALKVIREKGIANCTARAIADSSPLTKSALHYYFHDTDEIINIAFERLVGLYISRISSAAKSAPDPTQALWDASRTYLHLGSSQRSSQIPMLWWEAQILATRSGDTNRIRRLSEQLLEVFIILTRATAVEDADMKARVLFAALPGILLQDAMEPLDLDKSLEEILTCLGFTI